MKLQNIFLLFISCSFMLVSCTSSHTVGEEAADQAIVSPDSAPTSADVDVEENSMPESTDNVIVPSSEIMDNNFLPTFEEAIFSFENANSVRPENIVQEFSSPPIINTPHIHFCGELSAPEVCDAHNIVDWPDYPCILTQGWKYNEKVTITINFPTGEQTDEVRRANIIKLPGSGAPAVSYCPAVPFSEKEVGKYKVIFEGKSGRVEKDVLVQIPLEPRVREYSDEYSDWKTGTIAILTGFQPQEPVQLFVYESYLNALGKYSFVAWSEYTTDNNGGLLIKVPPEPENGFYKYYVLGESSRVPKTDIIMQ